MNKRDWRSIIGGKPPSISRQIADATQGDAAGSDALDNAGAENLSGAGATCQEMTALDHFRAHARNMGDHLTRMCRDLSTMTAVLVHAESLQKVAVFAVDVSAYAALNQNGLEFHLPGKQPIGSVYCKNEASNQNVAQLFPGAQPAMATTILSAPGGTWKRMPLQSNVTSVCLVVPSVVGTGLVRVVLYAGIWAPSEGSV